ncbi:hypothetical protein [Hoeflea poritis]|uniref:Uncharacterized protein n=1 Tax=Hoeflea poritis TaxID=2993659 RepID=A0ABT4VRQ5_9HYPH|nr:hypothetical protein [Hoeflea poritis]MDA4846885.1 hypothetical protein [Hoeflea poritis]
MAAQQIVNRFIFAASTQGKLKEFAPAVTLPSNGFHGSSRLCGDQANGQWQVALTRRNIRLQPVPDDR